MAVPMIRISPQFQVSMAASPIQGSAHEAAAPTLFRMGHNPNRKGLGNPNAFATAKNIDPRCLLTANHPLPTLQPSHTPNAPNNASRHSGRAHRRPTPSVPWTRWRL